MAKLTDAQKVEKYFKIEEHNIFAAVDMIIRIDADELKPDEDELIDISDTSDDDLEEIKEEELIGSISIPGMFTAEIPEKNDEIQLYFPFDINLILPDVIEKDKSITTYYYNAGDLVCFATTKSNATDIMILDKLFENRIKYLSGDLEKHVTAIYEQMKSTNNVSMHHIETILTLLYGEYTSGGFTPTRLTKNAVYSKDNAINTKESAHRFNAGLGFNYGYTKDVVVDNITRTYDTDKTDLEKIISGKFDELGK